MAFKVSDIPKNPVTLKINGFITTKYLEWFMKNYLPAWDYVVTSEYRDPEHNREIGGAELSAHQWNTAKDIVLKNKKSGEFATPEQHEKITREIFKPYWEGYVLWEPPIKSKGQKTGHIHVNLPRSITNFTKFGGLVGITLGIGVISKSLFENFKHKNK